MDAPIAGQRGDPRGEEADEEGGEAMSGAKICAIGETKVHPDGKRYRKDVRSQTGSECAGCSHNRGDCPLPCFAGKVGLPIESGGSECSGTIWKLVEPAKPSKPAPKPLKWEPVDLLKGVTSKTSRADLIEIIRQAGIAYNAKGREIVRLKNQSRKSKA
jgi:hypothetical protein